MVIALIFLRIPVLIFGVKSKNEHLAYSVDPAMKEPLAVTKECCICSICGNE
jgi:hypothetical protein